MPNLDDAPDPQIQKVRTIPVVVLTFVMIFVGHRAQPYVSSRVRTEACSTSWRAALWYATSCALTPECMDVCYRCIPLAHAVIQTSTSPPSETSATEDSLEDLTNELQRTSPYPIAFGSFGDIWKCNLVKPSGTVQVGPACSSSYGIILNIAQVAVKTIRSFESDNAELTRKNATVIFLFHAYPSFQPYLDLESAS
jgi:hypothetical protein